MTKPIWSNVEIINQLDSGNHWSGLNLTYAFPTSALPGYPVVEASSFTGLNSSQQAVATQVIQMWDDLIVPNFTLSNNAATANIRYGNYSDSYDYYAHAYYPGGSAGGTVWFNRNYDSTQGTNDLVTPTRGE